MWWHSRTTSGLRDVGHAGFRYLRVAIIRACSVSAKRSTLVVIGIGMS